ncbi:MAG TPA: hypothetical protein VJC39_02065 [Candidatus Nanoarchaeia archaeon]|nr:hypothetical protein [Candidatus Nanoarchaeia archaeon]
MESEDKIRWAERVEDCDPLEFYKKHYAGMTRWQLYKEDSGLYSCLRIKGLLKNIPKRHFDPDYPQVYHAVDNDPTIEGIILAQDYVERIPQILHQYGFSNSLNI